MSRFFNKRLPFFGSSVLSFGKVYFGQPDSDPLNQDDNSKAPLVNVQMTIAGDAVQDLNVTGMLPNRLFVKRPYSVASVDSDDNLVDYDLYYAHETTDTIPNASSVAGTTLTDALNTLQQAITAIGVAAITNDKLWPVGSLYLTTANENPGSRLNHGRWDLHCQGVLLCGMGAYTDSNGDSQSMGASVVGAYQVKLTTDQIPAHTHFWVRNGIVSSPSPLPPRSFASGYPVAVEWNDTGNNDQYILKGAEEGATPNIGPTSDTGAATGHDNVQPSIGVYIWRRYE